MAPCPTGMGKWFSKRGGTYLIKIEPCSPKLPDDEKKPVKWGPERFGLVLRRPDSSETIAKTKKVDEPEKIVTVEENETSESVKVLARQSLVQAMDDSSQNVGALRMAVERGKLVGLEPGELVLAEATLEGRRSLVRRSLDCVMMDSKGKPADLMSALQDAVEVGLMASELEPVREKLKSRANLDQTEASGGIGAGTGGSRSRLPPPPAHSVLEDEEIVELC